MKGWKWILICQTQVIIMSGYGVVLELLSGYSLLFKVVGSLESSRASQEATRVLIIMGLVMKAFLVRIYHLFAMSWVSVQYIDFAMVWRIYSVLYAVHV